MFVKIVSALTQVYQGILDKNWSIHSSVAINDYLGKLEFWQRFAGRVQYIPPLHQRRSASGEARNSKTPFSECIVSVVVTFSIHRYGWDCFVTKLDCDRRAGRERPYTRVPSPHLQLCVFIRVSGTTGAPQPKRVTPSVAKPAFYTRDILVFVGSANFRCCSNPICLLRMFPALSALYLSHMFRQLLDRR